MLIKGQESLCLRGAEILEIQIPPKRAPFERHVLVLSSMPVSLSHVVGRGSFKKKVALFRGTLVVSALLLEW